MNATCGGTVGIHRRENNCRRVWQLIDVLLRAEPLFHLPEENMRLMRRRQIASMDFMMALRTVGIESRLQCGTCAYVA
jgi:hypothetical protein